MRLPFQSLFESRSLILKGWDSVASIVGGAPTTAGVTVTETAAEGLPTVFACVRVIASAVAQLPLKLFQVAPDGSKTEAIDHPLFSVLHDLSNPELTAYDLRCLLTSHLLLWGQAFAQVERNTRGEVTALWPLLPWAMHVDRDDRRRLRFTYQTSTGESRWLYDPSRPPILRLTINSLDGITGRSVVSVLREALGVSLATQELAGKFFSNGSGFGGILMNDQIGTFDDEEKEKDLRQTISDYQTSANKLRQFLVLFGPGEWKYERTGIPPEDSQFLETRKFQRSELAGAFGVPPHMIGDLERATFSNIENESLRWLRDGLEPYLSNWEASIRRDLLGPRAFNRYYPRFVRQAMLRGDLKSRSEALAIMRKNGVINANEWRRLEEMNPISVEDGGDEYIVGLGGSSSPAADADSNPPREERVA